MHLHKSLGALRHQTTDARRLAASEITRAGSERGMPLHYAIDAGRDGYHVYSQSVSCINVATGRMGEARDTMTAKMESAIAKDVSSAL